MQRKHTSIFIFIVAIAAVGLIWIFRNNINPLAHRLFEPDHQPINIDTNEFAPGHPLVRISANQQLLEFPLPQYRQGHQLLPLFNWIDPVYSGGWRQPGKKLQECIRHSLDIQKELCENWNYYFLVSSNTKSYLHNRDTNSFYGSWINYANHHPELKTAAITFRAQVRPIDAGKECMEKNAMVFSSGLDDECYLRNANGQLQMPLKLSPVVKPEQLVCDQLAQVMYIDCLLAALRKAPDIINENGEVFNLYSDKLLRQDVNCVADLKKYGNISWNTYQAIKRLEKEVAYRDAFMSLPALHNTKYTQFAIDGHGEHRFDYNIIRSTGSPIRGQFYATPDFYPRYPSNWRYSYGAWHGLDWVLSSRTAEIKAGDRLFSPFVAAGWDPDEEKNIRPAQWLGLLKILQTLGAEFFYPGFFNTEDLLANPDHYIWQNVIPAYAQAIGSRYEDILLQGELCNPVNYLIPAGDQQLITVVRKSAKRPVWIICCSIQPNSNNRFETPLQKKFVMETGGHILELEARRQGSVYLLDASGEKPTLHQLDRWHEYTHPARWKKGIFLEAETSETPVHIVNTYSSDHILRADSVYISLQKPAMYSFQARSSHVSSQIYFRIKSTNGISYFNWELNGTEKNEEIKVSGKCHWIAVNTSHASGIKAGFNQLKIPAQSGILVDKCYIVPTP